MSRMTRDEARAVAADYRIDLKADFHTLSSEQVERVIRAADVFRYRQPRNANGSRARYFHAHLVRTANRRDDDDGGARSEALWQARMGGDLEA